VRASGVMFGLIFVLAAAAANNPSPVSFNKDVLPILQNRCQECHRAGEAAPMSFVTYKDARPWAKAMREAVLTKKMPPWFADARYGKWHNDPSLTPAEIQKIVAWADGGAPEGDPKEKPAPRQFVDGWRIGAPDAVFEMPNEFTVPASGTVDYHYVVFPKVFTEDKWVQFAEVRPGNRAVVHHVIAFLRPPGSKWMADAQPGVPFIPRRYRPSGEQPAGGAPRSGDPQRGASDPQTGREGGGEFASEMLVGFAPGMQPMALAPGQAKLVKAGSDIVFQMHWTANGKTATDRTRIGLIFAKGPVTQRVMTRPATNARFVIPAGAPNHEVESAITFREEAHLISFMPHMHLRGKDFEYSAVYPSGERQTLLRVPRYDFNWQLFYYPTKPLLMPKDTRLECVGHFDNSPNNRANPDPTKDVRWGDQSWEEMMIGWFEIAVDVNRDPGAVFSERRRTTDD